jgi:hypothetical protein
LGELATKSQISPLISALTFRGPFIVIHSCNKNQQGALFPYKTRPAERPRLRWMDQVEEDLKRMKIIGWRAKVEDRQK